MNMGKSSIILLIILLISLKTFLFASEELITDDINDVFTKTKKLVNKYSPGDIVVVFDIDNTILAANQDLGSDQWFSWQEELLINNMENPNLIAHSFEELLRISDTLLALGSMKPPQKETPRIINDIQKLCEEKRCVNVFCLTSRGHEYKYYTLREVKKNGIDFSLSTIGPKDGYPSIWKAYDQDTVSKEYSFSQDEITHFKLDTHGRDVTFSHGIFFTAGQNKGAMLRIILKKANFNPKAIIFVDDKEKHTHRVQMAYKNSNIEVITFRYSKEDTKVEAFNKTDKSIVTGKWKKLKAVIDEIFPK